MNTPSLTGLGSVRGLLLASLLTAAAGRMAKQEPDEYRKVVGKVRDRQLAKLASRTLGEITPVAHGGGKPWASKKSKKAKRK